MGKNDYLLSKKISSGHFIMFIQFHTSTFWTWICWLFEKLYFYDKVALCYSPKIGLKSLTNICVTFHAPSYQIEAFCKQCHSYLSSFHIWDSICIFLIQSCDGDLCCTLPPKPRITPLFWRSAIAFAKSFSTLQYKIEGEIIMKLLWTY